MTSEEILDLVLRPLTECCGKIPSHHINGRAYCYYCEMDSQWCQCDTADICSCEGEAS